MKKTVKLTRSLCAGCGKPLQPGDAFCTYCGKARSRQQASACSQCGAMLSPGSAFCNQCGCPATAPSHPPISHIQEAFPGTAPKTSKRSEKKIFLWCGLAALALLLIAGILFYTLIWPKQVQDLVLSEAEVKLELGYTEECQLTYEIFPHTASSAEVTWNSTNEAVATVTAEGKLQALSPGTCTVNATAGAKTASVRVTVANPNVSKIQIVGPQEFIKGEQKALSYSIVPGRHFGLQVDWHSSDTSVATVDSKGVVTAIEVGSCTIYAKCYGVSASITIDVLDHTLSWEEKQLVGKWVAVALLNVDQNRAYDPPYANMILSFEKDNTGVFFYAMREQRFQWEFLETENNDDYYVLTDLSDNSISVLAYADGEVYLSYKDDLLVFKKEVVT